MTAITISDLKKNPIFFKTKIFSYKEFYENIMEYLMKNGALPKYGEIAGVLTILVEAGLAKSLSDARRLVEGGAVELDGIKITDCHTIVVPYQNLIIRAGKHKFVKIVLEDSANKD